MIRWLPFLLLASCLSGTSKVEPSPLPPEDDVIGAPPQNQPVTQSTAKVLPAFVTDTLGADLRFVPSEQPVVTLGFGGDVLLHRRLQRQAQWKRGYAHAFAAAEPLLKSFDLMVVNLEGPTAVGLDVDGNEVEDPGLKFDDVVYTSFPRFNYHPNIISALKDAGVDLVLTANNHAMDRDGEGVNRTIDALEAAGMPFTGTRRSTERRTPFHTTLEAGGLKVTYLACTYGVGGPSDRFHQVNYCFRDKKAILAALPALQAESDFVVVLPHWGDEYTPEPTALQREVAREYLEAGADAVVGAHPHVLQPWEGYVTADGRQTVAMYWLGNFISNQRIGERRSSVVLSMSLSKDGQRARLVDVGLVPIKTDIEKHVLYVKPIVEPEVDAEEWAHILSLFPKAALRSVPAE